MIQLFRRPQILLLLFFAIWPFRTWASDWVVSVDERNGLPTLMRGGSPVVATTFSFFGRNWDWTYLQTEFKVITPYRYSLAGKNKALDFDLTAQIQKQGEQKLTWNFALDAHSGKSGVSGGGIVFEFDPALFAGEMGEPTLLPTTAAGPGAMHKGDASKCASSPHWRVCTLNRAVNPRYALFSTRTRSNLAARISQPP
jgi:hypothetical protein